MTEKLLMTIARDIAMELLPHFAEHVLAGRVSSYGVYAKPSGGTQKKDLWESARQCTPLAQSASSLAFPLRSYILSSGRTA